MAGDWIAVRVDLERDPAVVHLARTLKLRTREVVGHLVATWGWFDSVSRDGHAPGVTPFDLDSIIGLKGWSVALQRTPGSAWLEVDSDGYVIMPRADRWTMQSGKSRALATRRKALQRSREAEALVTLASRSERDKCVNTGQDRTVTTLAQHAAPARKARNSARKTAARPPNPEHQPAIDFWCSAFARTRGQAYAFSDKDARHVKLLLERASLETFQARAIALLESADPFYASKGCDLGTLVSCWNRLTQVKPPTPSYLRPSEPEPATPHAAPGVAKAAIQAAIDAANGRTS